MPLELESGESTGYGLGWYVGSAPLGPETKTTIFGHGGSSVGGFTSLMTLPEHGIVVAVTTNVSFAENLPLLSLRLAGIFAGVEAATSQDFVDGSVPVSRFAPRAW
jgi:CubicO group peptidase (beta-lactamase class C family)